MTNIDLPDYLKRSKTLNNLTVRRLLKYWAIVCSVAVVILSLTAVITNDIVSTKQEKLNNTAIPIEENVRNLGHVLYAFEQRQQNLIKAETPDEHEINLDRSTLEQRFSDYFRQLNLRIAELDNAKPIVNDLEKNYNRYLKIDSKLTDHLKTKHEFSTLTNVPDNFGEQLRVIEAEIMSSKLDIQANLKRLSAMTSQYIKSLASLSFNISQINLLVVVALSLIVVAVIAAGISVVLYRINTPLGNISGAMHDLSHGDMSRRLLISELIRDEFSDLSFDFNKFAARTQSLFDEVNDAKDALEESEKRTRAILENALVGIAHLKDQHIVSVNQKFEELFGYARETLTGMHIKKLYPADDDYMAINETTEELLASGETYHGEWKLKHESGNHFWCDVSAKSISEDNFDEGTIWLFEDITQRKNSEDELRRMANFDTLTDLPNRALFQDRLMQAMERASRNNSSMALIYIDLDQFKKINDSFGHSLGDELLKIVSKRLRECVRGADTVSRLGGDEFTIILSELKNISDAGKVSEKIISIMEEPFELENQEVNISPSIGISIFPDDASDMETILKNADAAMYHAKSKGRNNYQYYTQEMNAEARHRLDLEGRLRRAIDNHDFIVFYQPQ
ncbi:MAG: diguanylate cyclase, partial [Candidatus Neomarinimicrobiota bacterium]